MIPRIIWQTWKSSKELPANFSAWRSSLVRLHPEWDMRLMDDKDNLEFVTGLFPWFLGRYREYPAEIFRADAIRYFYLYDSGGFYVDIDTMGLQSFEPLRATADALLGRMGPDETFEHSIPNAIMASIPRHPFWLVVISLLMEASDMSLRPEVLTGPVLLRRALLLYTQAREECAHRIFTITQHLPERLRPLNEMAAVTLLPARLFYPLDWNDAIHQECFRKPLLRSEVSIDDSLLRLWFPASYAITFWTHSWAKAPNLRPLSASPSGA